MKKTERYGRRNPIDYILIILPLLLLLSIFGRALALQLFPLEANDCQAEVAFVIRAVDEETMNLLRELKESDFRIAENAVLKGARISGITKAKEVVDDGNGNLIEVESGDRYDVTFQVASAAGAKAKDGTFLLSGGRRLAQGDTLTLVYQNAQYSADFVKVRILG